jgi:hypothetical protein
MNSMIIANGGTVVFSSLLGFGAEIDEGRKITVKPVTEDGCG